MITGYGKGLHLPLIAAADFDLGRLHLVPKTGFHFDNEFQPFARLSVWDSRTSHLPKSFWLRRCCLDSHLRSAQCQGLAVATAVPASCVVDAFIKAYGLSFECCVNIIVCSVMLEMRRRSSILWRISSSSNLPAQALPHSRSPHRQAQPPDGYSRILSERSKRQCRR